MRSCLALVLLCSVGCASEAGVPSEPSAISTALEQPDADTTYGENTSALHPMVGIWRDRKGQQMPVVAVDQSMTRFFIEDRNKAIWIFDYTFGTINGVVGGYLLFKSSDCTGPSFFESTLSRLTISADVFPNEYRVVPDNVDIQNITVGSTLVNGECSAAGYPYRVIPYSTLPVVKPPASFGTPPFHMEFVRLD